MQCKDIPTIPILKFLEQQPYWSTYGEAYSMCTVQDAMPKGTSEALQLAKMSKLIKYIIFVLTADISFV